MKLVAFLILFAGALGIFEATTLWGDGERTLARLVFAISAGAYLAVALWYFCGPRLPHRERR